MIHLDANSVDILNCNSVSFSSGCLSICVCPQKKRENLKVVCAKKMKKVKTENKNGT